MSGHYTLWGSLSDLALMAGLRIFSGILSLLVSYELAQVRPEFHFDLYHQNGEKKTREELELEAMEEPFWPEWFKRYVSRPAFACEVISFLTQILAVVKCLGRMNQEIGIFQDAKPCHPLFWIAVAFSSLLSVVEMTYIDSLSQRAAEYGSHCLQNERTTFFRRVGSTLSIPLLSQESQDEEVNTGNDEENLERASEGGSSEMDVGVSDITGDSNYKAGWSDLLYMCYPDAHYIIFAFAFLLLAAVAQVYIPKFTGNILDALATAFSGKNDNPPSIFDVPGFISNVKYLVVSSILCGIFSGARGSIFTLVGGRVNVRLRVQLMDSLLSQGTQQNI
jgi:hypothetical protein